MAQVTVFVDDAVQGTLPGVCVKDGVATVDHLVVRDELGDRSSLGIAWLLLLLGPLGWIGLLIMSVSRGGRGEVLTIQVPMSEAAYQRLRSAHRLQRGAVATGVLGGVLGIFAVTSVNGPPGGNLEWRFVGIMAAVAVVGAILALLVADHRLRDGTVHVDLDASRRWVTLTRVHPAFVAACQAHQQRQDQRT